MKIISYTAGMFRMQKAFLPLNWWKWYIAKLINNIQQLENVKPIAQNYFKDN